jgi:tetratricopeptide (TPR) repeat protein
MKAEHRKELETNALANYMGTMLQKAKEGPSQKVLITGGLIVLVVVLVGVFLWYAFGSKDKDAERWVQWNTITQAPNADPAPPKEEIAKLRAAYPGKLDPWLQRLYVLNKFEADNANTTQARMARFQKARLLLDNSQELGSGLSLTPHDTTLKCIGEARDLYEKLITEASDEPALAQEAILNSAKANEDLGDFDKARKLYEQLKKDHPKGMYVAQADKALARLDSQKDYWPKFKQLAEK